MEEEKINEEFIKEVKYYEEHGMSYSNNPIEIPSNTNYQTFFEAVRCRLPLRLVPEKMIDFNMAKWAINFESNNVCSVPHNILNRELVDLALSQQDLPFLGLLIDLPSEYLTNEVYEKYLQKEVGENLKYIPEKIRIELQDMIDENSVKQKYGKCINCRYEKLKLFENFIKIEKKPDKIAEKEKNTLFQIYPSLKEEYQQFIYQRNFSNVKSVILELFPHYESAEEIQDVINTCECSKEQKQELWELFEKRKNTIFSNDAEIDERFICLVKHFKDNDIPFSSQVDFFDTNYNTYMKALSIGLPLNLVPKPIINFNMAKHAIDINPNNVCYVPHPILNKELLNLALSHEVLPPLSLLDKFIPKQYMTKEVYMLYLQQDKKNIQYFPKEIINELSSGRPTPIPNSVERKSFFQILHNMEKRTVSVSFFVFLWVLFFLSFHK
jgi:hypothetical protein